VLAIEHETHHIGLDLNIVLLSGGFLLKSLFVSLIKELGEILRAESVHDL
jgi:hypothetical protein